MKGDPVGTLARAPAVASTRGLSTARSVLRVLALLVERPSGVRADEVAARQGKSTSTAYYLLSSLCEEGFAVHEAKGLYRPAAPTQELGSTEAPVVAGVVADALSGTVEALFTRTRRRSYLGVARGGRVEIVAARGRQGVPRVPGLGTEIRDSLHALAMGKVVLAELEAEGLSHYLGEGLRAFTPYTITDPARLVPELDRVRAAGVAIDRDEFEPGFCCIAAPIRDGGGRFAAALGLSVSTHAFDGERDELAEAVTDIAGRATRALSSAPRRRARRSGSALRTTSSKQMQKTSTSCHA